MNVPVKVFRVNPLATIPTYAHDGDSGMDLSTPVDVELTPGVPVFVDVGIALEIPEGYEGQIRSRSGLTKRGITACSGIGTVDRTYRGSLGVTLLLHARPGEAAQPAYAFKAGERIAQLVIAPVARAVLLEVATQEELCESVRGVAGFGSTGR